MHLLEANKLSSNVINCIKVIDNELEEFDNGDLDNDWYEVVDISAVRLQTDFIKESFSNSDFNHEEDFENNSVVDVNADTIDIEEIYCINGEDNNNDLAIDWYDVVDVSTVRI